MSFDRFCLALILGPFLIVMGCFQGSNGDEQSQLNGPSAVASYTIDKLWEADGFSEPESVFTFGDHEWLYVSNPNQPDPGFISRVSKDGRIDSLRWVDKLNRPTGMAEFNGNLYVVDLDRVHEINLEDGSISKTLMSTTGKSLNDIAITSDGKMYVSDVESGSIYTNEEDSLVRWDKLPAGVIPNPNAMLATPEALYIGNVGEDMAKLGPGAFGGIYRVSYSTGAVEEIPNTSPIGTWDGLVVLDDGFLASSTATGEIWHFSNGEKSKVSQLERGGADFGFDASKNTIYVPFVFGTKVIAYQIKRG